MCFARTGSKSSLKESESRREQLSQELAEQRAQEELERRLHEAEVCVLREFVSHESNLLNVKICSDKLNVDSSHTNNRTVRLHFEGFTTFSGSSTKSQ